MRGCKHPTSIYSSSSPINITLIIYRNQITDVGSPQPFWQNHISAPGRSGPRAWQARLCPQPQGAEDARRGVDANMVAGA